MATKIKKNTNYKAYTLGVNGFKRGLVAPAQDKEVLAMLTDGLGKTHNPNTIILKSWLKGFHDANLENDKLITDLEKRKLF
jgi:hypothetical protein